jgi:hypothetical protein
MRRADLAKLSHCSAALIRSRLVAQYSAVPSVAWEAEYFDFSKALEPNNRSVTAAQSGLRDGLQTASIDVDLPVRFQTGQEMPAERANRFQIFNRPTTFYQNKPVRD